MSTAEPKLGHSGQSTIDDRGRGGVRRVARRALLPIVDAVALTVLTVVMDLSAWVGLVYALAALGLLAAQNQHRLRICLRVSDQVPRLVAAGMLPLILVLPWSRVGGVFVGMVAAGLLVAFRGGVCAVLRSAHRHGYLLESTLIVGAGPLAVRLARMLDEHPEYGLRPHGLLDRREPASGDLLGHPEELSERVKDMDRVLVCFPEVTDDELVSLLRRCRPMAADVCVVPRLWELGMAVPRSGLDEVWGIPLLPLRNTGRQLLSKMVKRGFDVVAGLLLSALVAPLLLALAGVVRIRGGAAFFRQLRVTRFRRSARVVKLRTVSGDATDRWHVGPDQCTHFGRWLRGTHLDELPQLVNVVRGEMSLVGPRPERPCYAMRFAREIPHYDDRHRMPGGMTGWAQVHGLHGDTSIPDRARFDNHYIEYWSLWLDVVILARTVTITLAALAGSLVPAALRPLPALPARGRTADRDFASASDIESGPINPVHSPAGGERREGATRDHRAGRGRSRAPVALDTSAHSARRGRGRALQPR